MHVITTICMQVSKVVLGYGIGLFQHHNDETALSNQNGDIIAPIDYWRGCIYSIVLFRRFLHSLDGVLNSAFNFCRCLQHCTEFVSLMDECKHDDGLFLVKQGKHEKHRVTDLVPIQQDSSDFTGVHSGCVILLGQGGKDLRIEQFSQQLVHMHASWQQRPNTIHSLNQSLLCRID